MGSFISTVKQDPHCPTPGDVFAVRGFLLAFVPAELANLILNEAKYWPKATMIFEPEDPLVIEASHQGNNAHVRCLVTSRLCDLLYGSEDGLCKINTVCFKIVSHDQGWCSNVFLENSGRYEGSHTWFEAKIIRDIHNPDVVGVDETPDDEDSDAWVIQRNERANKEFQLHTVVWTEDEGEVDDGSILMNETGRGLGRGFVRSLTKEDMIIVMARAQYPGWANYIKSVELEIYYSV